MSDVDRLASDFEDLALLLLADEPETAWANELRRWAKWIRRGDGYGVTAFLEAARGLEDRQLRDAERDGRFQRLVRDAWRLAEGMRHDAEPPPSSDIGRR